MSMKPARGICPLCHKIHGVGQCEDSPRQVKPHRSGGGHWVEPFPLPLPTKCDDIIRQLKEADAEYPGNPLLMNAARMLDSHQRTVAAQRTALLALAERIRREGMQGVANELEEICK